jgi:hypothetical protein
MRPTGNTLLLSATGSDGVSRKSMTYFTGAFQYLGYAFQENKSTRVEYALLIELSGKARNRVNFAGRLQWSRILTTHQGEGKS